MTTNTYPLLVERQTNPVTIPSRTKRWSVTKLNQDKFRATLERGGSLLVAAAAWNSKGTGTEQLAEDPTHPTFAACNISIPFHRPLTAKFLQGSLVSRDWRTPQRKHEKTKQNESSQVEHIWEYCKKTRELQSLFNLSKRVEWYALRKQVDTDTWDLGYQTVIKHVVANNTEDIVDPAIKKEIVSMSDGTFCKR